MGFKKRYIVPALALLLVGTLLGVKLESFISDNDTLAHLRKLENAFLIISKQYVDDVDPKKEVEYAITGMLRELDPHSAYISAEEIREVQEGYQGSFGGIGIWFEIIADTARVISTIADGPSERVGVMAGDRIVEIDDSSAVGLSSADITKRLKGAIGTPVVVTMKRPGTGEPIHFDITRGRIPIYTIDSAYMLDDRTGYIKVSRFAVTTYEEFMEHLNALRDQGMQRLVLDLRDNPGGVMGAAVQIADEMLSGGHTIVYTKGRNPSVNEVHRSTGQGVFEQQPVIVLVSTFSASASEIVAGALQDHDRALIVGQRTFGKGLVQQQFPLPDGSVLQMTVSRYYTPVGRLIQTPYESGDPQDYYEKKFSSLEDAAFHVEDYVERIPDSLKYETDHGRVVFGGGGILPDYVVPPDTTSAFWTYTRRSIIPQFVRDYFNQHEQELRTAWADREQDFIRGFVIEEPVWEAFLHYVEEARTAPGESTGENADTLARDEALTTENLSENRATVETLLKAFFARQLYSSRALFPVYNQLDPELAGLQTLWGRAEQLATYHGYATPSN